MALNRAEWLPAFASMVGGIEPTPDEASKLLDLATVVSFATDPFTAAMAFWIVGRSECDLPAATRAARFISAWDDTEDHRDP
jgi:hypothetical protein